MLIVDELLIVHFNAEAAKNAYFESESADFLLP